MEHKVNFESPWLKENQLYCGHTPTLLNFIKPQSVDCSIWSPPYFVGKEYERNLDFESWQTLLNETIKVHSKILKPGAFMVINIADILAYSDPRIPRFQAANINKLRISVTREDVIKAKIKFPDYNRYQLANLLKCSEQTIDRRLNGNNIRGGKYKNQTRVLLTGHFLETYAYENELFLYDVRVWIKDPTWQNSQWHSSSYRSVGEFEYLYFFWKPGETHVDRNRLKSEEWAIWGSRGVWKIPSVRANKEHQAQFPIELPERLIRLLTDEGALVLDPFMGSGSTALAAIRTGRNYIGIDSEKKYIDLARKKIKEEQEKQYPLFEN